MVDVSQYFIEGERRLGFYQAELARLNGIGHWTPTIPPLMVIVTNYRLLLYPQTRRKYTPASIPARYLQSVGKVELGTFYGIRLILRTGYQLNFVVGPKQQQELFDDIEVMRLPPTRIRFDETVPRQDIERLVQYLESFR
ncbi:MAG: hypothetical protein D6712_07495 [Chloroflexi bacterium]|nr:MAG: hypothetical protein D6712_07495 [Chloroflexota bacterium]